MTAAERNLSAAARDLAAACLRGAIWALAEDAELWDAEINRCTRADWGPNGPQWDEALARWVESRHAMENAAALLYQYENVPHIPAGARS